MLIASSALNSCISKFDKKRLNDKKLLCFTAPVAKLVNTNLSVQANQELHYQEITMESQKMTVNNTVVSINSKLIKERPILFNAAMVNAILKGCKTQTRRVITSKWGTYSESPMEKPVMLAGNARPLWIGASGLQLHCPYGDVGDQLWVRETFSEGEMGGLTFKADIDYAGKHKWTPSIHMPRWASRIELEITKIRVEHLNDINKGDVISEGCYPETAMPANTQSAVNTYRQLWESINGNGSWEANPWVWVVEFKLIKK